jgi:hypothetical protein
MSGWFVWVAGGLITTFGLTMCVMGLIHLRSAKLAAAYRAYRAYPALNPAEDTAELQIKINGQWARFVDVEIPAEGLAIEDIRSEPSKHNPMPNVARLILELRSTKEDAYIAEMEAYFQQRCEKYGVKIARRILWWHVMRTMLYAPVAFVVKKLWPIKLTVTIGSPEDKES